MPLTSSGRKALSSFVRQYGAKKGKENFYKSINKGIKGSSTWHLAKKRSK